LTPVMQGKEEWPSGKAPTNHGPISDFTTATHYCRWVGSEFRSEIPPSNFPQNLRRATPTAKENPGRRPGGKRRNDQCSGTLACAQPRTIILRFKRATQ